MADPLSGGAVVTEPKGSGPIAKLDFAIYRVEQILAWGSLLVMAVGYFLAILDRELTAGAGQNALDRFIMKRLGHTTESIDPALLDTIHGLWTPLIAGVGALLLLVVAAFTRRPAGGVEDGPRRVGRAAALRFLGISLVVIAVTIGLILAVPAKWFVGGMVAVVFGLSAAIGLRKGRIVEVALVGLPLAALLIWFTLARTGSEYTWFKSLSKVLLMWVGFLGASMATFENRNVQVDFVRKSVPAKWLRGYEAVGSLVTGLFTVVLAALAYDTVVFTRENSGLLPNIAIHEFIIPLPILIGFVLIAFRYLLQSVRLTLGLDEPPGKAMAPETPKALYIALGALTLISVVALATLGKGAWVVVTLTVLLAAGAPLYVVIGGFAIACFAIWPEVPDYLASFEAFTLNFNLMERMRELADQESLIAIPFFMIAGAVMSRGAIARQLVRCAAAAFGWLPGGLAVSAVAACMFFAAISGSSPVTVITIGAIMLPALRQAGYPEQFSLGLVTSAGSLGIIIPPSIPMIVYAIFATLNGAPVDIKDLFIAGIGPGLVIGAALSALCVHKGWKLPRSTFSVGELRRAVADGFWALFLPGFILIGIYFGIFNAVEASAIAVILALLIELFVHRELKPEDLPAMLADSAALMGSILVIISVALGLSEFLTIRQIPDQIVNWLASYELSALGFVLILNVLLLIVGCLMDIISAMILFVPLIIPLALQLDIDPIHLGLIFIVNLEIGYLTPPLGLNLFVASGFFQKPFGQVMRSVLPFIAALAASLAVITALPTISLGLVNLMNDKPFFTSFPSGKTLEAKARTGMDTAPTGFVAATSDAPGESGENAGLQAITNRSRSSEVEATGTLLDFDAYGVRAVAVEEAGKHVRTAVILTSESENCGEEDDEAEDEEWLLRIEFPAKAPADKVFKVGDPGVSVELSRWGDGEKGETRTPDSGVIVVLDPELEDAISRRRADDELATEGLFGAFELKFGDDTLNGKFVPMPCDGVLLYK